MIMNQMAVFGMTLIDGNVLLLITSAILAIGTLLFWCFQIRAQPGKRVMAQSTKATTQQTPAAAEAHRIGGTPGISTFAIANL